MKQKIVLWGTNAQEEKVLIALELKADQNKVVLHTFPESIATEEFTNSMMNEWRNGQEVPFPDGTTTVVRDLSVTDTLLPEDLKVERGDVIQRAQTEWHFIVLGTKLNEAYRQELAEFKDKVRAIGAYDHTLWDGLRSFWDKVQEQVREKNLYKEHADELRDGINGLFDDLKKLRLKVNEEFTTSSQRLFEDFGKALDEVDSKIEAGGQRLTAAFEELKNLQRKYRDAKLTNDHRSKIWDRLDAAFKAAKEKRFGPGANEGTLFERHSRRMEGLMEAIKRMEDSIRRDTEELDFQNKKVAATEGQLEAQIRIAKIKMIDERIGSKKDKLNEMNQTKAEVERQIALAKEKESKRAEKDSDRQKFEAAKSAAKEQIAAEIKHKANSGPVEEKSESIMGAIGNVLGETFEDAVDTMKAVATVLGDKLEEALDKVEEKADKVVDVIVEDQPTTPDSTDPKQVSDKDTDKEAEEKA